jgi:ATP-dependent Clp protease ATP-binding subunit ClpA
MQRLIQDTIRKALADELLFGRLVSGGRVTVDLDEAEQVLLSFDGRSSPASSGGMTADGEESAEVATA